MPDVVYGYPTMTNEQIIREQLGPLIFGYILNIGLCGILITQYYTYNIAFPNDRLATRILIHTVFLLEFVQSVLIMHDVYITYVAGFGNFDSVYQKQSYYWFAIPMFTGIIACLVQISFAYRVHSLSGSKLLFWIIVLLAILQLGFSITSGVKAFKAMTDASTLVSNYKEYIVGNTTNILWALTSMACDMTISISMSNLLSRFDSTFKSTKILIRKVVRMTMETGSITAAAALMYLILVICGPVIGVIGSYHIMVAAIMSKLYSNSLLVVFNSRATITGNRDTDMATSDFMLNTEASRAMRLAFRTQTRRAVLEGGEAESDMEGLGGRGIDVIGNSQILEHPSTTLPSHNPSVNPGAHGFIFVR